VDLTLLVDDSAFPVRVGVSRLTTNRAPASGPRPAFALSRRSMVEEGTLINDLDAVPARKEGDLA
jgi:hypothetical protein